MSSVPPVQSTVAVATPGVPAVANKTGMCVVVFFLLWIFIWILIVSFRPTYFRYCQDAWCYPEGAIDNIPCDPARALIGSLIITLVIMIIAWLVMAAK